MKNKLLDSWSHRCSCRRETSATPARDYVPVVTDSGHRPMASYSHKRKPSRDPKYSQERQLDIHKTRAEQREMANALKLQEVEAIRAEQEALLRVSEVEYHTRTLDEQRRQILSETRSMNFICRKPEPSRQKVPYNL